MFYLLYVTAVNYMIIGQDVEESLPEYADVTHSISVYDKEMMSQVMILPMLREVAPTTKPLPLMVTMAFPVTDPRVGVMA